MVAHPNKPQNDKFEHNKLLKSSSSTEIMNIQGAIIDFSLQLEKSSIFEKISQYKFSSG